MEFEEIQDELSEQLIEKIKQNVKIGYDPKVMRQYYPENHAIMDMSVRPDKIVKVGTGRKDPVGGKEIIEDKVVKLNRTPLSYQKIIVSRRATFLCGKPVKMLCKPADEGQKDLLTVMQKTDDDNKLRYKNKRLAKMLFSEKECAELWFADKADPEYWDGTPNQGVTVKFRMKMLGNSLGDTLYPVFNAYGDMVAFGRAYTVELSGGKKEQHFDLYTKDKYQYSVKKDGVFEVTSEPNEVKKIPVIYGSQPFEEWHDVQPIIERQEIAKSNHADTNDYNASPTIKVKGKIEGWSEKGEQGKVVQMSESADADYMAWNQAIDSTKFEFEDNERHIYDDTSTPRITFEQMKGLGDFSGVALQMLFLDAHMAASDKEEVFGEYVQRRYNYLKAAHVSINSKLKPALKMKIEPEFEYYLPKNNSEKIGDLVTAKAGGILSTKTSVEQNPLVSDPEQELKEIQKDGLNNEFNNENP